MPLGARKKGNCLWPPLDAVAHRHEHVSGPLRSISSSGARGCSLVYHRCRECPDKAIVDYAKAQGLVVLTHDLDFGAILAATRAEGPGVVQIRTEDAMSDRFVALVSATLTRFEAELSTGALVIVDESRSRVRVLPMGS